MRASVRKRWNVVLLLLVVLTLVFIWGNSLLEREMSGKISQGLLAELYLILENVGLHLDPTNDHWLRKLAHFGEFGLLGLELGLLMFLNRHQCVQGFINCASIGLAVAVTDEALQLISNRGSQVQDVLLDFVGFTAGLLLCGMAWLLGSKNREQKNQSDGVNSNPGLN